MSKTKKILDVLPHKHVHREKWKDLPSQEWFCLTILLTNNANRVSSQADSTSSRHHVWLYPENQQQKYEKTAQGQLPIGWHAWKVESKKKPYRAIHELRMSVKYMESFKGIVIEKLNC